MEIQRKPNDTTVSYDDVCVCVCVGTYVTSSYLELKSQSRRRLRQATGPHRPHHRSPQTSPATVRVMVFTIVTVVGVIVVKVVKIGGNLRPTAAQAGSAANR